MRYYFRCKKCGSDEAFGRVSENGSGMGCAMLMFGGILPALLYAEHQNRRVQCKKCSHIFQKPKIPSAPSTKLAKGILAALCFVPLLVIAWAAAVGGQLPEFGTLWTIEDLISEHPRIVLYALVATFLSIVSICVVAGIAIHRKHIKALRQRYKLDV